MTICFWKKEKLTFVWKLESCTSLFQKNQLTTEFFFILMGDAEAMYFFDWNFWILKILMPSVFPVKILDENDEIDGFDIVQFH